MAGEAAYDLSGAFVELCDCEAVCPCWIGLDPDEDRCTGVFGWAIEEGHIDDVDVAGCQVVSVSFHTGHRDPGSQRVLLYVDERADDRQFERLATVFTGQGGGPLAELGTLLGTLIGTERAPVEIAHTGRSMTLTVGRRISGDGTVLLGADGEQTELLHGRLSNVLGPRAEVGRGTALRVGLGDVGFEVQVTGRSAMRGRFQYVSVGTDR